MGVALEQSLRYFAGDVYACGRGCAGQDDGDRYALDLAGWAAADEGATEDCRTAQIAVPERPGLGLRSTWMQMERAHALYNTMGLGARDDAAAMQFLVPGWTFEPEAVVPVR